MDGSGGGPRVFVTKGGTKSGEKKLSQWFVQNVNVCVQVQRGFYTRGKGLKGGEKTGQNWGGKFGQKEGKKTEGAERNNKQKKGQQNRVRKKNDTQSRG